MAGLASLAPPLYFCRMAFIRQDLSAAPAPASGIADTPPRRSIIKMSFNDTRSYTLNFFYIMRNVVHDYLYNAPLKKIAASLVGDTDKDTLYNDFSYLKRRITYLDDDPQYLEVVRSPVQTILNGAGGDCDDMSVAAATILLMQNFSVIFQGLQWRKPEFTHVYSVARSPELPNGVIFDLTQDTLGTTYATQTGITRKYLNIQV